MSLLSERVAGRVGGDAGDRDGTERQAERLRIGLAVDRARPVEHRVGPVELGEEVGMRRRPEIPHARLCRIDSVGVIAIEPVIRIFAALAREERVGVERSREEGRSIGTGEANEIADHFVLVVIDEIALLLDVIDVRLGFGLDPADEVRVPGVGLVFHRLVDRFGSAGRGDGRRDGRDFPVGDRDRVGDGDGDPLGEVECDLGLDGRGGCRVDGRDDLLGEGGLAMNRRFLARDVVVERRHRVRDFASVRVGQFRHDLVGVDGRGHRVGDLVGAIGIGGIGFVGAFDRDPFLTDRGRAGRAGLRLRSVFEAGPV